MALTSASIPTKNRILTTCVQLFLKKGYNGTTVIEILREAEVSASSFQNIFRNKEGVLLELVQSMFENQFGTARKIAGAVGPAAAEDGVPPGVQLRQVGEDGVPLGVAVGPAVVEGQGHDPAGL